MDSYVLQRTGPPTRKWRDSECWWASKPIENDTPLKKHLLGKTAPESQGYKMRKHKVFLSPLSSRNIFKYSVRELESGTEQSFARLI